MTARLDAPASSAAILLAAVVLLAAGVLALGRGPAPLPPDLADQVVVRAVQRNNLPLPTGVDWPVVAQRVADIRAASITAADAALIEAVFVEACRCAASQRAQVTLLLDEDLAVGGGRLSVVAVTAADVRATSAGGVPLEVDLTVVVEHGERVVRDEDGGTVAVQPSELLTERWTLARARPGGAWRLAALATDRQPLDAVLGDAVTTASLGAGRADAG